MIADSMSCKPNH